MVRLTSRFKWKPRVSFYSKKQTLKFIKTIICYNLALVLLRHLFEAFDMHTERQNIFSKKEKWGRQNKADIFYTYVSYAVPEKYKISIDTDIGSLLKLYSQWGTNVSWS